MGLVGKETEDGGWGMGGMGEGLHKWRSGSSFLLFDVEGGGRRILLECMCFCLLDLIYLIYFALGFCRF